MRNRAEEKELYQDKGIRAAVFVEGVIIYFSFFTWIESYIEVEKFATMNWFEQFWYTVCLAGTGILLLPSAIYSLIQ